MRFSPYSDAPSCSFWSRSVSKGFSPDKLIPEGTTLLAVGDAVMSAGSCFASNIVPYLEQSGFRYVRTERKPVSFRAPSENLGYDNFSAAYGNIYTARQLSQLLDRSLGFRTPSDNCWEIDGEFVDPFRPGLRYRSRSRAEFNAVTRQHLDCVLAAFREANVFVSTLGLTEAWESVEDGSVFPACPGTVAGAFDASRHRFRNLRVYEVSADLARFIERVRSINPALRLILTVSPVPLVATATGGHVLTATIYSKSVLRVAAQETAESFDNVIYFPAYEIVTGPQAPDAFFEDDKRNVSRAAIDTVMATFLSACHSSTKAPVAEDKKKEHEADGLGELSRLAIAAECEEAMSDAALGE